MKQVLKALVAVWALVMVCFLMLFLISDTDFKTELNTATVPWLPPEAKHVSLKQRGGFGAMEFIECTISEEQFRNLAKRKNWELGEIKDKLTYGRIEGLPLLLMDSELGPADLIRNGLISESRAPNGGGYTVLYDIDLQRMIYSWSAR